MNLNLTFYKNIRINKHSLIDLAFILLFIPFYLGMNSLLNYLDMSLFKGESYIIGSTLTPLEGFAQGKETVISGPDSFSLGIKSANQNSGVVTIDPRILAMQRFLLDNGSPMAPYANTFIQEADKYGLDWRLVASISAIESIYGNLIPYQSYNAWGWRGGPGGKFSKFKDWNDGISTVTKGLAQGYGTNLTPYDIEPAYCPPCYQNPNHSWAATVTKNMNELKAYLDNL